MWLLLATLSMPVLAAGEDCARKTNAAEILAGVNAGEASFAALDHEGFITNLGRVDAALHCLGTSLDPNEAAAFHRMHALGHFLEKDTAAAAADFRALRLANPTYELDEYLLPEGHPLRTLFDEAGTKGQGATAPVLLPPGTILLVDGRQVTAAPTERPYLAQVRDLQKRVLWSGHQRAGEPLPDWVEVGVTDAEAMERLRKQLEKDARGGVSRAGSGNDTVRWVGAGTALVLSGAFYGLAARNHSRFASVEAPDPTKPEQVQSRTNELLEYRARTNEMLVASMGMGAVAAGLGVSAMLTVTW